jgi:glycogen(starch) synthase
VLELVPAMRILLCSNWFYPSFGGVESISRILAEEWVKQGCDVTVVTQTPGEPMGTPYEVIRQASRPKLREMGRWADVIVQNIISLQTLLPLLTSGKPIVVVHNSWMRRSEGPLGWENRLKRLLTRLVHNVSVSKAIADDLPVKSTLIGNPFSSTEFEGLASRPKGRALVFMGRLVSDKGADTLLEALRELRSRGMTSDLTIIGDGPEMPKLKALAEQFGISEQITFTGALREIRGAVLAEHKILVVPSRWAEPFGIVALEGIASGCAVVASEKGGLPDAAGPAGRYFPNGDSFALADTLQEVLLDDSLREALAAAGSAHVALFAPDRIASEYLNLFRTLAPKC